MNEQKKLYKISEQKMICGVCAGIAEYLNVDVSIVRLVTVLIAFACGSGLIAYIAAAIILPEKHDLYNESVSKDEPIDISGDDDNSNF